jgi:hypothetical protein
LYFILPLLLLALLLLNVLTQVAEPSHDENYHKERGISSETVEKITDDKPAEP